MIDDQRRVVPHTVDECRASAGLPPHPDDDQTRHGGTTRRAVEFRPAASSTGSCSHGYCRRYPVAHITDRIPAARRSSRVRPISRSVRHRRVGPQSAGSISASRPVARRRNRRSGRSNRDLSASAAAVVRGKVVGQRRPGRRQRRIPGPSGERLVRSMTADRPCGSRCFPPAAATVHPAGGIDGLDAAVQHTHRVQPPHDVHAAVLARTSGYAARRPTPRRDRPRTARLRAARRVAEAPTTVPRRRERCPGCGTSPA